MWFGYVTFGFISDAVGRKRTYVVYLLTAAALMAAYATSRQPLVLLVLGPFVAFFGTGYFTGFGAVTAEIYPDRDPRDGAGLHLQHGPGCQRGRADRRRLARPDAGFRRRLHGRGDGVRRGRRDVDLHPRNPRARARVSSAYATSTSRRSSDPPAWSSG